MVKYLIMAEGVTMKDIHPKSMETQVTCACGEKFVVQSNKEELHIEVCSKCHPFYTGKQSRASSAGRVEKFNKKYGFAKEDN